jgi:hypothetical protein
MTENGHSKAEAIQRADEALLASLGYKQVRSPNAFSC